MDVWACGAEEEVAATGGGDGGGRRWDIWQPFCYLSIYGPTSCVGSTHRIHIIICCVTGLLSKLHAYIKKGNCMQRTDNRGDFHGGIQYLYGSLFLKGAKTRARRTRQ